MRYYGAFADRALKHHGRTYIVLFAEESLRYPLLVAINVGGKTILCELDQVVSKRPIVVD